MTNNGQQGYEQDEDEDQRPISEDFNCVQRFPGVREGVNPRDGVKCEIGEPQKQLHRVERVDVSGGDTEATVKPTDVAQMQPFRLAVHFHYHG